MSRPVRLRGRWRPGPFFQNLFCRIEVSWFTSLRVMKYGPADGMLLLVTLTTSFVSGSLVDVAWKNGIVILAMNVPSALVRLIEILLPLTLTPDTFVP